MPALSSMWPSQLLLVAIFIQQTCFSAQMKAHLEGELTPRMDFSFQGSNPINHLTGALGNNVANLFNPMQAVNAAFNAINGILKPAIPLTLPPTQLEFSSLLGFPRRSNGASLFPHTNSGNPPMSGSGSGIASLSVHNLGTNQPASRSTNEASVSFHTSMNNSPTTNPGSFGFSISGNGLDTGSRESPGSVSTSISRANIRLDPDATASSGPSRPSLGINLASSSSSSGPENSEAISSSVTGRNNRHGFRGRNLQMPGSPSRVFGQSLSKPEDRLFRDSSLTHINLLGSTKNDHHISPSSHGSSSSNLGHSSAISGALDEIEPRGSVGFSTSLSSIQLPSPSFRESLGSTNRRSFTVVDNSNRFTTAYARPNERRVILHTGGGQPEEDIIEISQFNFKSSTAARKNPEFNSYYEGAYCNVKSPFTLLKSERLGERTKYYHCIDGAMVAVICPTDKPALQDMCDGYAKHCWRYLAFDRSMTHEQINNNAYDYYTCLGKIPQGS